MKSLGFILSSIAVTVIALPLHADVIPKKKIDSLKKEQLTQSETDLALSKATASDINYFEKDLKRVQIATGFPQTGMGGNTTEEILGALAMITIVAVLIFFIINHLSPN